MAIEFVIRHQLLRTKAWCGEKIRDGDIVKHRAARVGETVDCPDCKRLIAEDEAEADRLRKGFQSIIDNGRKIFGDSPIYRDLEKAIR